MLIPGTKFYILHPWMFFWVILSLKLAPENGWLEDNGFPFGTWNLKTSPNSKGKVVWTEPTFVTLGLQHVNFPRVYRFFLMVLPLLDQQKASILLKSRQTFTNRRHGDRYVLWHNPWRVWVQKPLIGSSSQVWVWKDITNGDQEEKQMSLLFFIYRRKILIINILMISVAFLLIRFLSLFFELIVKIAFCFFEDQIVNSQRNALGSHTFDIYFLFYK